MSTIPQHSRHQESCRFFARREHPVAWLAVLCLWLASLTLVCAPPTAKAAGFTIDTGAAAPMTGLWWNPAESGWGMSMVQQGPIMFIGWYTYDQSGASTRYFMSNCAVSGDGCSGDIYRITGGAAPTAPWTGRGPVTTVGTGTLTFSDKNNGLFNFVLNGVAGTKNIVRNVFGAAVAPPAIDYTALWWNPNESGWGVFITHQSPTIFAVLFTYDAAGNPMRYVASSCPVSGSSCSGTLYKTSGGSAPTVPWGGPVTVTPVGTITFAFSDSSNGTMSFTIDGQPGAKTISKMIFYTAPGDPSSYGLIDAAKAAGTITTEQALIYKMYVEFADPALPAQYHGDDTGLIEGDAQNQVTAYIDSVGLANVAASTLDVLRPFFVPAYFEGSWWHKQHPTASPASSAPAGRRAASKASAAAKAASPNCRAWESFCSILTEWKNVAGPRVVVWYEAARDSVDGPRANILMQEFENTIWPSLTTLMGRTPLSDVGAGLVSEIDGRLDVILVDMPADKEGQTVTSGMGCKAVPSHIYLNRNLSDSRMLAQAAHEFMHAIQSSYAVKSRCVSDYFTTLEATAVWATNHVYATNDWEHTYAKHYLAYVDLAYDDKTAPKLFRYGAYLFPLFLQTRFGASIVKEIWDQTLNYNDELYAINGALVEHSSSFEKEWPRFVAANWNRDTLDTYKFDRLAETPVLESNGTFTIGAGGMGSLQQAVSLPHASSAYYRARIDDATARSLMVVNGWSFKADAADLAGWGDSLTFTGLNALERAGASMQVYLKVNGVWQSAPVNMKNVPWLTACRDDPAGKIEEIVFMYANAEISPTAPNYTELAARAQEPGLFATNIGCRDWTGSINMTSPLPGGQETLNISNIVLKNAMPAASAVSAPGGEPTVYPLPIGSDNTVSPGYGYVYSIASGTATWTYNSRSDNCSYTGSKSLNIANAVPSHTLSSWTPPGAAAHGSFLTGFLGANILSLSYDWICTDADGKVRTGTDPVGTDLDVYNLINDSNVRISSGTGLSMSGTGLQSGDPLKVTGTWSFQGATN